MPGWGCRLCLCPRLTISCFSKPQTSERVGEGDSLLLPVGKLRKPEAGKRFAQSNFQESFEKFQLQRSLV